MNEQLSVAAESLSRDDDDCSVAGNVFSPAGSTVDESSHGGKEEVFTLPPWKEEARAQVAALPCELPSDMPSVSKLEVASSSKPPCCDIKLRPASGMYNYKLTDFRNMPSLVSCPGWEDWALELPGNRPRPQKSSQKLLQELYHKLLEDLPQEPPAFTHECPSPPLEEPATPPPYEYALDILSHSWRYDVGDKGKETGEDAAIVDWFGPPEMAVTAIH
ncbi:hypothetical protein F4821DRAFT_200097 [Hypoxylon rubiginosum]|uniref:Uncharacterized protein n=1 Tax=Hypoxylon rubiginosum TaxID=110542 RepID=A0ACC0DG24_9PEZI|nr:hypothetical protein F4821DRAFT_200097 [Hypoxylon rubiginosum]